ncbi:MAG: hypothetical protein ABSA70_13525 [Terriglobia bacterium]
MSTFARTFPIEQINSQVLEENPWFKDMLLYWRPAGDALHRDMTETHKLVSSGQMPEEDPKRLRLAIRDGSLNLYRGGQSIAKVEFGSSGGLQARIHNKYVYGDKGSGQAYVTLTSAGLHDQETGRRREYSGPTELDDWVSNANKHVGKEKRFVDLVVARNPDTIDLEMALPAYSLDPKERKAPRMDLVALEPVGKGWRVVFWEAKLVNNGEARCQGESKKPKVVVQLGKYTKWIGHGSHRILMAQACKRTCELLVDLHEIARRFRPDIEELGRGIREVAAPGAALPSIDAEPRLLIDDRTRNVAFTRNGHLDKLRNTGLHVQMVQDNSQMTLGARA